MCINRWMDRDVIHIYNGILLSQKKERKIWVTSSEVDECRNCYTEWETFLVAQMVKHLPTMLETRVQSPGWDDLLEQEMATHSSILAWKIPWTEEPGGLQSKGSQKVGHDWATSLTQSEVSQKEKNRYSILTHIYMEPRKMVLMNLTAGKEQRCRQSECTSGHSEGGKERDERRRQYIYTTLCKTAGEKMLDSTGSPAWYAVTT